MSSFRSRHPALTKYILLQIPEAALVAFGIAVLINWGWIDGKIAFVLVLAWIVKDIVMYPIVRPAYEQGPAHGTDALIGERGVVQDRLAPKGRVRIGAEIWSAVGATEGLELDPGEPVVVERVDGFTVVVAAEKPTPDAIPL